MIYYTIGKTKEFSGGYSYSLNIFSSKKAVLLFTEKEELSHENNHRVVAAGYIELDRKIEYCSGWQPELGDSLAVLREWAKYD